MTWRAYQAGGAGNYIVIHADDGRDFVFMHLQDGSITVTKGAAVTAGQVFARVGSTGRSTGPHLHFEIWPDRLVLLRRVAADRPAARPAGLGR